MKTSRLNIRPNTLFTNDNLFVLNGLNSECVDMIYLDPPFNSKRFYSAPIGSKAAGASFKDMWTWSDVDAALMVRLTEKHPHLVQFIQSIEKSHSKGMMSYIAFMAQRVFEMRRVLKPAGSIYLHCDPTASHYLKILMDTVFGKKNFIDEVIWDYGTPSGGRVSGKKPVKSHETLLAYAANYGQHVYNRQYTPYTEKYVTEWFRHTDEAGRKFQTRSRNGKIIRQYLDESSGMPLTNVWSGIKQIYSAAGWFPNTAGNRERSGYPTEKPLPLLDRIITASSNPGDLVLDPFCGCATTLVSAQLLDRQWIGIDIEKKSGELIKDRLTKKIGSVFNDFVHRKDLPVRTDIVKQSPRSVVIRQRLFGMQNGQCNGCKARFDLRNLETDHIIPVDKGGGNFFENYQLLCANCNRIKGNRPMEYLTMVIANRKAKRTIFG